MKATNGSFVVIGGQATDIPEEQRTEEAPAVFKGIYKDGTWWLSYPHSGGSSDAQGGSQNQQQGQNQEQTPQQQAPQEGAGDGASGNGGAQ